MSYENNEQNQSNGYPTERKIESVFSKRLKAGKKRTYFFDVRATRGNDYFIILTESTKRFNDGGYERHKLFLYKEDFNKFLAALEETINFVKTDLMPNFDFDAFKHENYEMAEVVGGDLGTTQNSVISSEIDTQHNDTTDINVDKW